MTPAPAWATLSYHDTARRLHVSVVCDRFLFSGDPKTGAGRIVLLSVLGAHSAVRGILAAASTGRELRSSSHPHKWFSGPSQGGGRFVTLALTQAVTHGVYLAPQALAAARPGSFALLNPTPERLYSRLIQAFALPAIPAWAAWLDQTLRRIRQIEDLHGHGATGAMVATTEDRLDQLIATAVRDGTLAI